MGKLIVVEGIDGAGKNTLVTAVAQAFEARGMTVSRTAFPRYDEDVHAALIRDALHGKLGDVSDSVYGMGLLFALDRRDAAASLRAELDRFDVVLVDRYVASNAAYAAARLREDSDGAVVAWVRQLEIDRFSIPVPDVQVLLDVPASVAAERAQRREAGDASRARDSFETDGGLQRRCADVYRQLAASRWLSEWIVVDGSSAVDTDGLLRRLAV